MKNEKFCFSKGTGLIALVGVLLVGFVLFTQAANQPTSSNTKAAPPTASCTFYEKPVVAAGGTVSEYTYDTTTFCIKHNVTVGTTTTSTLTGARCKYTGTTTKTLVHGNAVWDSSCNPAAATRTACQYGNNTLTTTAVTIGKQQVKLDTAGCILVDNVKIGKLCNASTGYAAKTDDACAAPGAAARTKCQYGNNTITTTAVTIGAQQVKLDTAGCILVDNVKIGKLCNASTGYAAKSDDSCKTPGRTACQYGNKTLTTTAVAIGAQQFKVDSAGCILADNVKIGKLCNASTNYTAVSDDACAAPGAAARTACAINGVVLADATTPGTTTSPTYGAEALYAGKKYALESPSDCVVYADTKLNQGLWCDRANGFTMKYNASKCSTTP